MDFFAYMEDAMIIPPGEGSLVDDFAAFVLKMMRYDEGRRVIHLRKETGFEMCGQRGVWMLKQTFALWSAQLQVRSICYLSKRIRCVEPYLSVAKICLPVTRTKRHLSRDDPEPQLIAEAIAAGLPKLPSRTFAGITMIGTAPTFYKIPVSDEILISLATSQYPTQVTTVTKLVPLPERLANDGIKPLASYCNALTLLDSFW